MKSKHQLERIETIKRDDLPTVGLVVRNVNGQDSLFTTNGELIANQIVGRGFHYYENTLDGERTHTFRVAVLMDNRNVKHGPPVEDAE